MHELKINKNDAGQRLDKFITKTIDIPASLLYKSIRLKKIKLNRKRTEANVILKEDGTLYILDWAHATQGAPCCDCARTYLTFCLDNDFDTANQYLEMYCNLSKIPTRNIQRWLPIVAASQSVKNIKEERELLLSWINVQDFE